MGKNGEFKTIIGTLLILEKDNEVLLARRCNTGHEDGNYSLVGGHLQDNESLTQAIIRETKEEIGIAISPENLKLVYITHFTKDNRIHFYFKVNSWEGEIKNMEPEKCEDIGWFPKDNLPQNTVYYIKETFIKTKQNITYSEL